MSIDLWSLYTLMLASRRFEEAVTQLWQAGLISGEMHLGTGEEAILAGVISHLREGDAMAVDHRGSAAFLMRGVDPGLLLGELLGREDGLCGGMGGHMHLFSKEYLAASSGIVGSGGPSAVGFALAARYLRPGSIAVAFFGEGAMSQGMLMEAINLAATWRLPVLFVCKDDGWAITTRSIDTTGGPLEQRVRGLGAEYLAVDGLEVAEVWETAGETIEKLRVGGGPVFLHAGCVHLEGHFLGLPLIRGLRKPWRELPRIAGPLARSFIKPGSRSLGSRLAGVRMILAAFQETIRQQRQAKAGDPITRARAALVSDPARLLALEAQIETDLADLLTGLGSEVAP
jgi:TPP-dependent pyruvate/acetoin dehydrogenase alpha subunit